MFATSSCSISTKPRQLYPRAAFAFARVPMQPQRGLLLRLAVTSHARRDLLCSPRPPMLAVTSYARRDLPCSLRPPMPAVTSHARRDPSAQAAQAASAGRLWQGRRRAAERGAGGAAGAPALSSACAPTEPMRGLGIFWNRVQESAFLAHKCGLRRAARSARGILGGGCARM